MTSRPDDRSCQLSRGFATSMPTGFSLYSVRSRSTFTVGSVARAAAERQRVQATSAARQNMGRLLCEELLVGLLGVFEAGGLCLDGQLAILRRHALGVHLGLHF